MSAVIVCCKCTLKLNQVAAAGDDANYSRLKNTIYILMNYRSLVVQLFKQTCISGPRLSRKIAQRNFSHCSMLFSGNRQSNNFELYGSLRVNDHLIFEFLIPTDRCSYKTNTLTNVSCRSSSSEEQSSIARLCCPAVHVLSIFCFVLNHISLTFLSRFLTFLSFVQCPRSDPSFRIIIIRLRLGLSFNMVAWHKLSG